VVAIVVACAGVILFSGVFSYRSDKGNRNRRHRIQLEGEIDEKRQDGRGGRRSVTSRKLRNFGFSTKHAECCYFDGGYRKSNVRQQSIADA